MKENINTEHRLALRSDNGSQMTSSLFHEEVEEIKKLLLLSEHEFTPI